MRKKTFLVAIVSAVALSALVFLGYRWRQSIDPDYRLRQGQEAARAGNFVEAFRYAQLLEDDGQSDRALLLRGEILVRQNDYPEALRTLNRIADQGALRLQAAALSGECLVHLGEIREAERVFRFVIAEDPRHIDAHRFLGAIYYDQGDLPAAVGQLLEVANLDPKDARPHRLIGLIYKDLDKTDDAAAAYEEALRRGPTGDQLADVRTELAECLLKQRSYARALQLVEGIDAETALAVRAEALINLDGRAEALPLLDRSLERFPDNVWLLRQRGEQFLLDNRLEDAAKFFQKAVQIDRSDFRSGYQFALALERMGKTGEAQAQHLRVKEVHKLLSEMTDLGKEAMGRPWDGRVRLRLADLAERLGKAQLAAMWRNAAAACSAGSE